MLVDAHLTIVLHRTNHEGKGGHTPTVRLHTRMGGVNPAVRARDSNASRFQRVNVGDTGRYLGRTLFTYRRGVPSVVNWVAL